MRLVYISLLFLLLGVSHAEETRYYDVEMIIFENTESANRDSETWPVNINFNLPEKYVELGEPLNSEWLPAGIDPQYSFISLPADSFELNEEEQRLDKSNTRRVLFHTRWRQPGLSQETALPVHFTRIFNPLSAEAQPNQPASTLPAGFSTETTAENPPPQLEGVFRVTLSRYLHLEAELAYRTMVKPAAQTPVADSSEVVAEPEAKPQVYYLNQTRRRMRSNELHYIDHPVLGILVRISPFIPPEPAAVAPPAKPATQTNKGSINR